MGMRKRCTCSTNTTINTAPDPCPSRWELLEKVQFDNGYVLKVRYKDCTNFEGIKILVFSGEYFNRVYLDPHFSDHEDGPVVRFKPDTHGWEAAIKFASEM